MKNSAKIFAFLLFAGTICSFQSPKPTLQDIFQTALDVKVLEKHFAKNSAGELLPLTIVSNDYIGKNIPLNFAGNKVFIQANLDDKTSENASILELIAVKMKGKKSHLSFKYNEKVIKIRLKKANNEWGAKTVTVKWKGGFDTEFVSTEEEHY